MTYNVDYDAKLMDRTDKYISLGYDFLDNNGSFIVTSFLNEVKLKSDIDRIIVIISLNVFEV